MRRFSLSKKLGWAVVGFGVVVCLLLLARWVSRLPYTRAGFNQRFLGASAGEVRMWLGSPDSIQLPIGQEGEGYWMYRRRTVDESGASDAAADVWMTGRRVSNITYVH